MLSDPDLTEGTPTFRGTTVPVRALFRYLASGSPLSDFLKDFPWVSRELAVQRVEDAGQLFLAAALGNSEGRQTHAETPPPQPAQNLLGLLELKGVGKEVFAELGGGEEFLRSERRAFAEGIEKQDRERGLL